MTRTAAIASLLLLAACTRDFGAFEFDARGEGGRDDVTSPAQRADAGGLDPDDGPAGTSAHAAAGAGGSGVPSPASDAGDDAPPQEGEVDTAAPDAHTRDAQDASAPAADAGDAQTDAGPADAGMPGAADAGDAGDVVPPCVTAWSAAAPATAGCGDCACDACTALVLACLTQGTPAEQALCQGVLTCTIAQDCGDACYCATRQCGAPARDGDGPCAAAMNAAAGGSREEVAGILATSNPDEPLVRAMLATGCLMGGNAGETGACGAVCP